MDDVARLEAELHADINDPKAAVRKSVLLQYMAEVSRLNHAAAVERTWPANGLTPTPAEELEALIAVAYGHLAANPDLLNEPTGAMLRQAIDALVALPAAAVERPSSREDVDHDYESRAACVDNGFLYPDDASPSTEGGENV
jgi:hypothetical protein